MHTHTQHNNLGLDSRCPTPGGVYCKTAVFCNQSILLLDGLSYRTDEHHLPGATGFKAPVTSLMSHLLSIETGTPALVTRDYRFEHTLGVFYRKEGARPHFYPRHYDHH